MRLLSMSVVVVTLAACGPNRAPFEPVSTVSQLQVRAVAGFADERGEAILVDSSGAPIRVRADGQQGTLHPHPGNTTEVGEVRAIFPMGPHRALIAAEGGVFVAASGWVMAPLWSQPLSSDGLIGAAESDEGSAWIAHTSGLFRVKDGALSELKIAGASVQGLTAIAAGRAEDGADAVWFAHDQGLSALVATAPGQLVVRPATLGSGEQEGILRLVALGDSEQAPGEVWALGKSGLFRLARDGWHKVDLGGDVSAVAGGGRVLWASVAGALVRFDADANAMTEAAGTPSEFHLLAADTAGAAWIRVAGAAHSVHSARVPRLVGLNQNERVAVSELTVAAVFPPGPAPVEVRYSLAGEDRVTTGPEFSFGGTTHDGIPLPYSLLGLATGMHTLRATAIYDDASEATREVPFDFQPVDNTPLSFDLDVRPIHVARCAKCHEGGPGHDLSTYEAWKQEAARISQAIRDRRMPADGPLDPSQATLIQRWAQSGALP